MRLKAITAALTAAVLAVGMAACNRDNAGAGSSSDQYGKRSGSAATGSSSSSMGSSRSTGSSSGQASPGGAGSGSSAGAGTGSGNSGASGNSK